MHENKNVKIARTNKIADFKLCARLMAATEPWLTLKRDYSACLSSVAAPLREVYAAKKNGTTLGFIILQMTGTFKGYIQTICVAPQARGRGIGTLMIEFAERRVFRETPNVFMCVSSFNKGARRLYKKLGYTKSGTLRDFITKGFDEFLLRKTLGPLNESAERKKKIG
jgi:ribosomal protein S18 acetylase RimI-like enzyme